MLFFNKKNIARKSISLFALGVIVSCGNKNDAMHRDMVDLRVSESSCSGPNRTVSIKFFNDNKVPVNVTVLCSNKDVFNAHPFDNYAKHTITTHLEPNASYTDTFDLCKGDTTPCYFGKETDCIVTFVAPEPYKKIEYGTWAGLHCE